MRLMKSVAHLQVLLLPFAVGEKQGREGHTLSFILRYSLPTQPAPEQIGQLSLLKRVPRRRLCL